MMWQRLLSPHSQGRKQPKTIQKNAQQSTTTRNNPQQLAPTRTITQIVPRRTDGGGRSARRRLPRRGLPCALARGQGFPGGGSTRLLPNATHQANDHHAPRNPIVPTTTEESLLQLKMRSKVGDAGNAVS